MKFSIILIPDTQHLVNIYKPSSWRNHYTTLSQWIVDNSEGLNLKMVLHLGDIVNNGIEEEFEFAKESLDIIKNANIPFLPCIGNHDYDGGFPSRNGTSLYNQYFGLHTFQDIGWEIGTYEENKAENVYIKINIEGSDFIFFSLEFGVRTEVLNWASDILRQYHNHHAIFITHSYMFVDGERTKKGYDANPKNYSGATGANDGEDMWNKLIKNHSNIRGVYSAHHLGGNVSHRIDKGNKRNTVFQSFQNWQNNGEGGDGRIRIIHYDLKNNTVEMETYSTALGQYEYYDGYNITHEFISNSDMKTVAKKKIKLNHIWVDVDKVLINGRKCVIGEMKCWTPIK